MPFRVLLLLLICLSGCLSVPAQIPGIRVYSYQKEFPASTAYLLSQDTRGYIWIGTDHGAVRFDGNLFELFDERQGLSDKEILWVMPDTFGGVYFLPVLNHVCYLKKGKVSPVAGTQNLILNEGFLDPIAGHCWLSDARSDRAIYQLSQGSFREIQMKFEGTYSVIGVIDDQIYLINQKAEDEPAIMCHYDPESQQLNPLFDSTDLQELGKGVVSSDGSQIALIYNRGRSVRIVVPEDDKMKLLVDRHFDQEIREVYLDKQQHLWVWFFEGGMVYLGDPTLNLPGLTLFDRIHIQGMLMDRDQNLWFTTVEHGLFFLSIEHWRNAQRLMRKKLLEFPAQSLLLLPDGSIGYGHRQSPQIYVPHSAGQEWHTFNGGTTQGIRHLKQLGNNWVGVQSQYLLFMDGPRRGEALYQGASVKDLVGCGPNKILLASHTGVYDISLNEEVDGKSTNLFPSRSTCLEKTAPDQFWIGTPTGLYQLTYRPENRSVDRVDGLEKFHITDLQSCPTGELLIGTAVNGLWKLNSFSLELNQLLHPMDHDVGFIRRIFVDRHRRCWLATDRGVVGLSVDESNRSEGLKRYTYRDGLPSDYVSDVVVFRDTLIAATQAGLGCLPLIDQKAESANSDRIWVSQAVFDSVTVSFPEFIKYPYQESDLRINLSVLTLAGLGDHQIRYRLANDSTTTWTETRATELRFSGLSPGSYVFEAGLVDGRGVPTSVVTRIPVTIYPRFWQTVWFKVIALMLLLVLLAGFGRMLFLLIRQRKWKQVLQKRKLAELELEAIKAQINPHFIYNCLNSIQYYVYKGLTHEARDYLDRFSRLIRQTMQFSQQNFVSLREEIDYLKNYLQLEKMRFGDRLKVEWNVEPNLDAARLIPAMVVQPYLENAIKHGRSPQSGTNHIRLHIRTTLKNELEINIEDQGPGIQQPRSQTKRKKLGHRLSNSRLESYNEMYQLGLQVRMAALHPENGTAPGTQIKILIPSLNHESIRN